MLSTVWATVDVQGSWSLPGKNILRVSGLTEELVNLACLGYSAYTAGPYLCNE